MGGTDTRPGPGGMGALEAGDKLLLHGRRAELRAFADDMRKGA